MPTGGPSRVEKSLKHYEDVFTLEHKQARDEWLRLGSLFKDVCWYNFETACIAQDPSLRFAVSRSSRGPAAPARC